MLTRQQLNHFDTFGLAILPQLFTLEEMERTNTAGDELLAEELKRDPDADGVPWLRLSNSVRPWTGWLWTTASTRPWSNCWVGV